MIGILLKVCGGVLIFIASSGIGLCLSNREKMQIRDLNELSKALSILKGEISFALTPFEEAAAGIAGRVAAPISTIFLKVSKSAAGRTYMSGEAIWENALASVDGQVHFDEEDRGAFLSLGKTLGDLDKQMQMSAIDMTLAYIESKIATLQRQSEKTAPMYRSLGFLGGILVAIVLL